MRSSAPKPHRTGGSKAAHSRGGGAGLVTGRPARDQRGSTGLAVSPGINSGYRTVSPGRSSPGLASNPPGRRSEEAADRVATQVMRMPSPGPQGQARAEGPQPATAAGSPGAARRVGRAVGNGGKPLDSGTRADMEARFGHDFSRVRVHTDGAAAPSARALGARAYTVGQDVVFGRGEYAPGTSGGRWLLAHELTHVAQQDAAGPGPAIQKAPLPEGPQVKEVPTAEKSDFELAHGIIQSQLAILEGWEAALAIFDKVLTSASDKSTSPNFKSVMMTFFKDKLMGEIISRSKLPVAGDAFALLGKLEDEVKRAAAAQESANLRDFFVTHRSAVSDLKQSVRLISEDFYARVRITGERIDREGGADEYGMMRMQLFETFESLERQAKMSRANDLFKVLSDEWIRQSTIPGPMGMRFPGFVVIRINEDYTVRDAEIKAPGGQKIAEQLLRTSPSGVDVFGMKVPRRVLYFKKGGRYYSAVVRLDANNRLTNEGTYLEGNYYPVYRTLMSNGLPPTKKLSGD